MKRILPVLPIVALLLTSCGGNTEQTQETEQKETAKNCLYTATAGQTTVNWTAFKFTEKTAVGGKFNSVELSEGTADKTIAGLLEKTSFVIPVNGVNSENPDRDGKIQQHFFGKMLETETISGEILSAEGTDAAGSGKLNLKMNAVENDVDFKYAVGEDNLMTITAEVDLTAWNGQTAVDALNKVCEDLHKGTDGVSKLWSVVEIKVEAQLAKDCK